MAKARRAAVNLGLLENWNALNGAIMSLAEEAVALLLAHEQKNRNRLTFTLRLHSRLNRLRRERERREIARA